MKYENQQKLHKIFIALTFQQISQILQKRLKKRKFTYIYVNP